MSVIVIGGMIGAGKTSVAKLLGEELGSDVFFEEVDNNPLLELFYFKQYFIAFLTTISGTLSTIFTLPAPIIPPITITLIHSYPLSIQ